MIASPLFRESLLEAARVFMPALSQNAKIEADPRLWVTTCLPEHFGSDPDAFADHHNEFWEHIKSIQQHERPHPWISVWSRRHNKTTSLQGAVGYMAATRRRRYFLYVGKTQDLADAAVQSIADYLEESAQIAERYPDMARPRISRITGAQKSWSRNRLQMANGTIIDAVGLDKAIRGLKRGNQRPDAIFLDDIDDTHDTENATRKKIDRITRDILPAGARNVAIIAVQNLIIEHGVFGRMLPSAREPADYLADRIVSGPIPAVWNMETQTGIAEDGSLEVKIIAGEPSWPQVMDIATCEDEIKNVGLDAFYTEYQHEPRRSGTKIYNPEWWADATTRFSWHDTRLQGMTVARFMSWDTASSMAASAAYSAVVVGDIIRFPGRGGHAVLIRDVRRAKLEFTDLLDTVRKMALRWNMDDPAPHITMNAVIIEEASSGIQLVQSIRSNARDEWLRKIVKGEKPRGSKDDRGLAAAQYCRNGRVWLPFHDGTAETAWVAGFEDELFSVPQSVDRDMTDAFSQLIYAARLLLAEPLRG